MSSHTLPKPPASDGGTATIRAAVTAVAEQSFFALVDTCDGPAGGVEPSGQWLASTVRFGDGVSAGSVSCWLSGELAQVLFDSFSGRDPVEPAPPAHQVDDLVGEFVNMVCGDWLVRIAAQRAFQLSPPTVVRAPRPAAPVVQRMWVTISDRPMAIDWEFTAAGGAVQTRG